MADTSGLSGDDFVVGTSGTDKLIGGSGSDTIDGGTGSDFINAGGGNDTIIYDESDYKILGAGGIDTLWFTGYQQNLILGRQLISGIEKLWLDGGGGHQVWLNAADIIRVSDNDQMQIIGNQTNHIYAGSGWSFSGLSGDGQSQVLVNGLAKLVVSLPVFVDGLSGNASFDIVEPETLKEDSTPPQLSATGTITITDPNAGQGLLLGSASAVGTPIGVLSVTLDQPWSTNNPASYRYSYQISNDAVQRLGKDIPLVESFTIQTIDGSSKTLDFKTIGVNDSPNIQPRAQTTAHIYELATDDPGENGTEVQSATGSFFVKDVDLGDNLTVDVTTVSSSPRGEFTALIAGSDADGNHEVTWIYRYTDAALNSLNSGDAPTEVFMINISDFYAVASQAVVLTLHGEDDFTPDYSFSIVEILDGMPDDENTYLHTVPFQNILLVGTSVSWAAGTTNSPNLGNFSASLNDVGAVIWAYTINDKYLDYLQENETVTQNFQLSITDGTSTISKSITIALYGTKDANEIVDPEGDGAGNFSVTGTHKIARGLDGDDLLVVTGDSHHVSGDGGNDRFEINDTTNSLIRGGNGDDIFTFIAPSSNNEIYGDLGDDLFQFKSLTDQQIWGGPGSDTFKVSVNSNATGAAPVINDFDSASPATGGDQIDLTEIAFLDWRTLKLSESTTVPNHHLLTAGEGLETWTILTIVGTSLELADLTDGNLIGYPV